MKTQNQYEDIFRPKSQSVAEPVSMNIRIDPNLRKAFADYCSTRGCTTSEVIRNFMQNVVDSI